MSFEKSSLTTLRRLPKRGEFDKKKLYSILDEAVFCHIGFVTGDSSPIVIPTLFGRDGDILYIHGSSSSRMLKSVITDEKKQFSMCLTVSIMDGLVCAKSAFHHSCNYRSVVVFGNGELIQDDKEKNAALKIISDCIIPNRWDEVRLPNETELKATSVIRLKIEDGNISGKIRNAPVGDDKEDLDLPIWSGIIPTKLIAFNPIADQASKKNGLKTTQAVLNWGKEKLKNKNGKTRDKNYRNELMFWKGLSAIGICSLGYLLYSKIQSDSNSSSNKN